MSGQPAIALRGVGVVRGQTTVLAGIDWMVRPGERWVVLGPNGAGKTTLLQVVTGALHPTFGTATVLGRRLGAVDVRELRKRIAVASGALTRSLDPRMSAQEVVRTGRSATLASWWDAPDPTIDDEAASLLAGGGLAAVADRPFAVLSEGERQRVLLARMRMARAELWIFDEPAAGLDLGARESLVATLGSLAGDPGTPPVVFVTHHVEEIPPEFSHALLLRGGYISAQGLIGEVLSSAELSRCFGLPIELRHGAGRWSAIARLPR